MTGVDPLAFEERAPEQSHRRGRFLTPRRVAAAIALVVVAVSLRRHLRFAREVVRHRRRLRLAFTVLMLLRHVRRS